LIKRNRTGGEWLYGSGGARHADGGRGAGISNNPTRSVGVPRAHRGAWGYSGIVAA
jgi:hypothetical protein